MISVRENTLMYKQEQISLKSQKALCFVFALLWRQKHRGGTTDEGEMLK